MGRCTRAVNQKALRAQKPSGRSAQHFSRPHQTPNRCQLTPVGALAPDPRLPNPSEPPPMMAETSPAKRGGKAREAMLASVLAACGECTDVRDCMR